MADGGLILILVVLILGGLIATLGDRIGTKVGKARLSLFNLRPRKTAVLVTVFTGVMISASTLGILLLASQGFRDMLLRFDTIRSSLDRTKKDLDLANGEIQNRGQEKQLIEAELTQARTKSRQVQNTLNRINASLKTAVARQQETESRRQAIERQAVMLRSSILSLQQEQAVLTQSRNDVRVQIAQRDQELAARSGEVAARDREIQSRKVTIAEREKSLQLLNQEQNRLLQESYGFRGTIEALKREQASLVDENTKVRTKLPAIPISKILSYELVETRIQDPQSAELTIAKLIQNANATAFRELYPGFPNNRLIINASQDSTGSKSLVKQMIAMQEPYVIQMRSAANYYSDEYYSNTTRLIDVEVTLARRLQLFKAGEVLAALRLDPRQLSLTQIREAINQLIPLSVTRLNQGNPVNRGKWLADVGNEGVDVSRIPPLRNLAEQIKERSEVIEIRALTTEDVYSETPRIPLALVFLQRDGVILDTRTLNIPPIQLQPVQP